MTFVLVLFEVGTLRENSVFLSAVLTLEHALLQ